MKGLIFFCVAVVTCFVANAQKSSIYARAGLNIASTTKLQAPDKSRSLLSFQAGFMADLVINKIFSLQPSVIFTGKGAKINGGESSTSTYYKATSNPFYIELPVNFVVKYPFYPKKF